MSPPSVPQLVLSLPPLQPCFMSITYYLHTLYEPSIYIPSIVVVVVAAAASSISLGLSAVDGIFTHMIVYVCGFMSHSNVNL